METAWQRRPLSVVCGPLFLGSDRRRPPGGGVRGLLSVVRCFLDLIDADRLAAGSVVRCFLDLIDADRLAAESVVRCPWSVVSWTSLTETTRIVAARSRATCPPSLGPMQIVTLQLTTDH